MRAQYQRDVTKKGRNNDSYFLFILHCSSRNIKSLPKCQWTLSSPLWMAECYCLCVTDEETKAQEAVQPLRNTVALDFGWSCLVQSTHAWFRHHVMSSFSSIVHGQRWSRASGLLFYLLGNTVILVLCTGFNKRGEQVIKLFLIWGFSIWRIWNCWCMGWLVVLMKWDVPEAGEHQSRRWRQAGVRRRRGDCHAPEHSA